MKTKVSVTPCYGPSPAGFSLTTCNLSVLPLIAGGLANMSTCSFQKAPSSKDSIRLVPQLLSITALLLLTDMNPFPPGAPLNQQFPPLLSTWSARESPME